MNYWKSQASPTFIDLELAIPPGAEEVETHTKVHFRWLATIVNDLLCRYFSKVRIIYNLLKLHILQLQME